MKDKKSVEFSFSSKNARTFEDLKQKDSAWWVCEKGHEWETQLRNRLVGSNCPYCSNRKLLRGFNDAYTLYPDLEQEWSPKNQLLLKDYLAGSTKKVLWICALNHEWEATIAKRTQKQGCPYCSGHKVFQGFNDFASQFPHLVDQWHPENQIAPHEVTAHSRKSILWQCSENHKWEASVHTRTQGKGCPVCSNRMIIAGINDLFTQRPDLKQYWSTENALDPTTVGTGSEQTALWICPQRHLTNIKIANRVRKLTCQVCAGNEVVIGFNDLATQYPLLAQEWSPRNDKSPYQLTTGSSQQVWWVCAKDHEWRTKISDRTYHHSGCPQCMAHTYTSQGEQALSDYIESLGFTVERHNRKILQGAEIDIYVPELRIGFEFNGLYWHSEATGKGPTYHLDKQESAVKAGIQLFTVWEDDWQDKLAVVQRFVARKLGVSSEPKYHARKLQFASVDKETAEEFLSAYHLQGKTLGSHWGLWDESSLLAVMTVRKEGAQLNILRFASAGIIRGGFTKLLKRVLQQYPCKQAYTFADHLISDGKLYVDAGFMPETVIKPDYSYIVNHRREHKFRYRLKRFKTDPALVFEEGLTEKELAATNGLVRIWDAGKTKYVLDA